MASLRQEMQGDSHLPRVHAYRLMNLSALEDVVVVGRHISFIEQRQRIRAAPSVATVTLDALHGRGASLVLMIVRRRYLPRQEDHRRYRPARRVFIERACDISIGDRRALFLAEVDLPREAAQDLERLLAGRASRIYAAAHPDNLGCEPLTRAVRSTRCRCHAE